MREQGRSLSLKLIDQLRKQSAVAGGVAGGRVLKEVVLEEPIRYSEGEIVGVAFSI